MFMFSRANQRAGGISGILKTLENALSSTTVLEIPPHPTRGHGGSFITKLIKVKKMPLEEKSF